MKSDRAMAAVSAEVMQLAPGITRLGKAAATGDSMVRALGAAVLCAFAALQLHLEQALSDPQPPTKWPGPVGKPVRGTRARQKRPGTTRRAKGQQAQARP